MDAEKGFDRKGHKERKGESATSSLTPTTDHRTPLASSWADHRAEILFWGAVAAITLMLAWGKYFPLYSLFYKLPVVNNIRNPNKFLQVFQLALGILAAYGLDTAMKWRQQARDYGPRTTEHYLRDRVQANRKLHLKWVP